MTFALAFVIGCLAGLRSLTPPAVTSWAAYLGWMTLPSSLAWIGSPYSAVIFAVLAVFELVADKLPKVPDRTSLPALMVRILTGGFCGAAIATSAGQDAGLGAALGGVGAIVGAFGGYRVRARLAKAIGRDLPAALIEDLVVVGASVWIVWVVSGAAR